MQETDLEKLIRLQSAIKEYQELANKYQIADIFQDNGGKYLEILIKLGLNCDGKRQGSDAFDCNGNEYEIKTINTNLSSRGFSTQHHLNISIIEHYRSVNWYFIIYEGVELKSIYYLPAYKLEPYFSRWESECRKSGKTLNNPKIPVNYVREHGELKVI